MDRFEPYFADDTDGVHFQVCIDGQFVQAYVARAVLEQVFGISARGRDCVDVYLRHRAAIDAAVMRRVRVEGPETVLVRAVEIGSAAIESRRR